MNNKMLENYNLEKTIKKATELCMFHKDSKGIQKNASNLVANMLYLTEEVAFKKSEDNTMDSDHFKRFGESIASNDKIDLDRCILGAQCTLYNAPKIQANQIILNNIE